MNYDLNEAVTASEALPDELAIQDSIPNRQGDAREAFFVEWGVRVDDRALVFHFFPPIDEQGAFTQWPKDSDFDARLKAAIDTTFDIDRITAGFEVDQNSFYVIAGGYGDVLDVRLLVERFLEKLEASP